MSSLEEVVNIAKPRKIRISYFNGKLVVKIRKHKVLERESNLEYAKKLVDKLVLKGYEIFDEVETNTIYDSTSPNLTVEKDDSVYIVDLVRV
jgi:hypothetical protein